MLINDAETNQNDFLIINWKNGQNIFRTLQQLQANAINMLHTTIQQTV